MQRRASGLTFVQDWTVRVEATAATFVVNGLAVATIAIRAGQLDGAPGMHVGVGGDVTVAAATVAGDSVRGRPGLAPVSR